MNAHFSDVLVYPFQSLTLGSLLNVLVLFILVTFVMRIQAAPPPSLAVADIIATYMIQTNRCDLCNVEFSSLTMASSHLAGKQHQKRLKVFILIIFKIVIACYQWRISLEG